MCCLYQNRLGDDFAKLGFLQVLANAPTDCDARAWVAGLPLDESRYHRPTPDGSTNG
jgi:hypothetical protein